VGAELPGRIVSYFEGNEERRTPELVEALRSGARVALITDGGMPSVSDPGYRLVRAAIDAGIPVTAAPGPSAVTTALALSGLPSDRFCFEGFPPRKPGERARAFELLADERRTMIFFEAPHRLDDTLAAMAAAFGADRPAAVCRELTKTYEEIRRGPLSELVEWASADQVRGEIVVVVGGASGAVELSTADLVAEVLSRADAGERLKDAVAEVAAAAGVPKRDLYAAALAAKSR
jgi:16S rRNA (cytidine1402-2'-O)-methyltransferase